MISKFQMKKIKKICIHFWQQVGPFPDPKILLDETPIEAVTDAQFLWLVFDQTLSFKSSIQCLNTSYQKALGILRMVDTVTGKQIVQSSFGCTDHRLVSNWFTDLLYIGRPVSGTWDYWIRSITKVYVLHVQHFVLHLLKVSTWKHMNHHCLPSFKTVSEWRYQIEISPG